MAPVTVKSGDAAATSKEDPKKRRHDSDGTSPSKLTKPDVPDFSEEKEAQDRSGEQDLKLFFETCDKVRKIFDQILQIKKSGTKKSLSKVNELNYLRQEFSSHFLTLKKLNRLDKLRTKQCRDNTQARRHQVDSYHLQLQNLMYEVLHLEKEVSKCLQFKSGDEDIDLVSVEEFYRNAPPEISRPDVNRSDPHLQRLARLEFEKLQRQEQTNDLKKKEDEKDGLETRIRQKKEQMAKLKPQLQSILASTKSLQEYLELPIDEEREQSESSKFLPHPLFVIFSETLAYSKVFDEDIKVSIDGDLNEAKAEFYSNQHKKKVDNEDNEDDLQNDGDEDEEKSKKKKKNRGGGKKSGASSDTGNPETAKIRKLLSANPLSVKIDLRLKKSGSVALTFKYLTNIEIVVVDVKLNVDRESQVFSTDREILHPATIFAHLLDDPEDSGDSVPNPTFFYRLQKLGLDGAFQITELREIGTPFSWVQTLAGMVFPKFQNSFEDESLELKVDEAISRSKISKILAEIKDRFVARLALRRQLDLLEKVKVMHVEPAIPGPLLSNFPPKINSKVRAWTSVDLEQYMALSVTQHLREGEAVSSNDFFYRLQINREFQSGGTTASLIALIAVKPTYPRDVPVFCLNLHWNGEHNARNSEKIRALEQDVNTFYLPLVDRAYRDAVEAKKGFHFEVLSLQIQHLMTSLDVLIDAWNFDLMSQSGEKKDVQRDKMFLHAVKGRRRAPPLKYEPGNQMFSQ